MVSTGDPQLHGTHDQWLVLITPSDVSLGLGVRILTETCPLVTNLNLTGTDPVSTRWSPPVILICVVLMISGSSSALTQSLL